MAANFDKWWMDWAFKHRRPQVKHDYSLGEAVRAAYQAGQLAEAETIRKEIAWAANTRLMSGARSRSATALLWLDERINARTEANRDNEG